MICVTNWMHIPQNGLHFICDPMFYHRSMVQISLLHFHQRHCTSHVIYSSANHSELRHEYKIWENKWTLMEMVLGKWIWSCLIKYRIVSIIVWVSFWCRRNQTHRPVKPLGYSNSRDIAGDNSCWICWLHRSFHVWYILYSTFRWFYSWWVATNGRRQPSR